MGEGECGTQSLVKYSLKTLIFNRAYIMQGKNAGFGHVDKAIRWQVFVVHAGIMHAAFLVNSTSLTNNYLCTCTWGAIARIKVACGMEFDQQWSRLTKPLA